MHPCWQLLERHADTLQTQPLLWLDPPEDHALIKASDHCVTPSRALFNRRAAQAQAPDESWPEEVETALLFYPKAKGRLEWWLQQVMAKAPRARLWVVGENQGGIKSLPKRVAGWADSDKLDSARHCALYEIRAREPMPAADDWLSFSWQNFQVQALPGVFSQNRLDAGTAVLLDALEPLDGDLLELGCGSGILSLALLSRSPAAQLTTVDIDWLAVQSARRTLADAGLDKRAEVLWSDGLQEVPHWRYDHLVTNPPFHTGLRTHYEPSEAFFAASHNWLKPGGSLYWVANEFLDYQRVLAAGRFEVVELAHARGFRVYRARLLR